jgi:sulfide dehydrogenase cytochrome subunit
MKTHRFLTPVAAAMGIAALLAGASALAEPPAGRLLASQCFQCHGTNGQARGDIDSLAGESYREILEEMMEMKYEAGENDIMHSQARGYSDEQLVDIAIYLAGLPDSGGGDGDGGSDGGGDGDDNDRDNDRDGHDRDRDHDEDRHKRDHDDD